MNDQDVRELALAQRTQADPDRKREQFLDTFRGTVPGFQATPGQPVWLLADATGEIAADLEQTALIDQPRAVLRYLGKNVFGLPAIDATPARSTASFAVQDVPATGAVIPAGTPLRASDVNFTLDQDTPVPAGATAVVGARVSAVLPGESGNGLVGPLDVQAALPFVLSAALEAPTSGGTDGETDDEYEQRFSERLAHLGRPTLPDDFADRLRSLPGVHRVLALDLYVPAIGATPAQTGVRRAITLVPVTEDGEAVPTVTRDLGVLLLQAEREANWVINVISPTYLTVGVTATVTAQRGQDHAQVKAAAEAAISAFLSPATWGTPAEGEEPIWDDEPTVWRSEINAALNNVTGLRRVVNDTILIQGANADLALPSPAGLPRAGTIVVTVQP